MRQRILFGLEGKSIADAGGSGNDGAGEQLDKVLRPYPEIRKAMDAELAGLSKCFSFYDITGQKEMFFWTKNPLPEASEIGPGMDVMPYVKSALTISIADYQERRVRELEQMVEKSQERLNQQFEQCKKKLLLVSGEYLQSAHGQKEWQKAETKVLKLEQEVSRLADEFLAEIHR